MSAADRHAPAPKISEHRARKEYRCDDPDNRGCARRILKGDLYVQAAYPPYTPPWRSPSWQIVRACSTCRPPTTRPALAAEPCPIGSAGSTCLLTLGHPGPHDYPTTLF